jgi:single-strand DNA-binding protein
LRKKEEMEMNKLTIIGNLTGDPELRATPNGNEVCTFTVAVNRRKAKGQAQEADFFRVSAWGERGKVCSTYLSKGKKVCVIGQVTVHAYNAQDGSARGSLEVFAEDVEFLTPKGGNGGYTPVDDEDDPFGG